MGSVSDLTLLNTRPAHQAGPLTQLLQSDGITTLECPAIAIQPLDAALPKPPGLVVYDAIFFISINAVEQFHKLFQQPDSSTINLPDTLSCYAIGEATRHALKQIGISAKTAASQFDTETLLRQLHVSAFKRALIVKGEGGRQALAEGLTALGVQVDEWVVYRRVAAPFCQSTWQHFQQAQEPVLLFTSYQAWCFLTEQLQHHQWDWAIQLPAIVFSKRIAEKIRQQGWQGPLIVVAQQSNEGIYQSLIQIANNNR